MALCYPYVVQICGNGMKQYIAIGITFTCNYVVQHGTIKLSMLDIRIVQMYKIQEIKENMWATYAIVIVLKSCSNISHRTHTNNFMKHVLSMLIAHIQQNRWIPVIPQGLSNFPGTNPHGKTMESASGTYDGNL